ncbi:hypothetical protein WDW89_02675 [Deltaproteobacteria bacterium TL4]
MVGAFLPRVPRFLAKASLWHTSRYFAKYTAYKPDLSATMKITGGFAAYPLFWVVESVYAQSAWGSPWEWWLFFLGPITGILALQFLEKKDALPGRG